MKMSELGQTGIQVSRTCLGTMTFGNQNSAAEGHAQLDMAVEYGVNFFDTAEMYAFPVDAKTYGRSEEILGSWVKAKGNRDKVVIATKVTSKGPRFPHIRDGNPKLNRNHIRQAVDDSLRRLQTDYIDLYQTHWPERPTNYFSRLGYDHDDNEADWTPLEETLDALAEQVNAGKIRSVGVSNETPWGVGNMLALADASGLPRIASIQNPYNLLSRAFDIGLAEIAIREKCGLLAYSPLGFGALSGKYLNDQLPDGSRHKLFPSYQRYFTPNANIATQKYHQVARDHGLNLAQMALAFVNSQRFLTSTIIGATSLEQLRQNLESEPITLDKAVVEAIERIHADNPNPSP